MAVDVNLYKTTMRRLAGAVCIITTISEDGLPSGYTATAVCSVTIDPPTLLVCANRSNNNHDMMHAVGFFAVNLLCADDQNLSDRFSGPETGAARFALGDWSTSKNGVPVLETAIAWFECRMSQHVVMGTHGVFFGTVESAKLGDQNDQPLLYFQGAYGGFAAA